MASPVEAGFPDPRTLRTLRRRLLAWYDREQRDLPWRRTRDPYAILVSEFMLQQTQVKTVLPYYERFLSRFPTLASLAGAPEDDVRASWSGLGYYRRARHLQLTARTLVADHGSALPDRIDSLRKLPGVGAYTAAALASIVHGRPEAVVDGNVIRVLTRLFGDDRPVARVDVRRDLDARAAGLLDPTRAGDWNQAVMELGATVCLPSRPRCAECPWARPCRARAGGSPERFPHKESPRAPVRVERAVGIFRRGGAVLLVRRNDTGLLDGTWEFPGLDVPDGDIARALASHLREWLGRAVRVGAELAEARHAITHRRIRVRAYAARSTPPPRARQGVRRWADAAEARTLPVSSMTLKILDRLAPLLRNPR